MLATKSIDRRRNRASDIRRQHRRSDLARRLPARQDHDAFDIIAELSNIARPIVGLQDRYGVLSELAQRLTRGMREGTAKMLNEAWDVLAPLRKRRNTNRNDAQPMIEILPESTL